MMRITVENSSGTATLILEGKLAGPWVKELENVWHSLTATWQPRSVRVDLSGLTFIDDPGKALLSRIYRSGSELLAGGCMTRATLEQIAAEQKDPPSGVPVRPPRNKIGGPLLTIFVLLFAARELRAQQPTLVRLTLRDSAQLAMTQNPQVQIATLNLAQREEDRSIARAALLPQGNLEVSDRAVRANIEASIGRRIIFIPQHTGPFQVFEAGSAFSVPVFDLSLWRRWQASRRGVEASESDRRGVREQIVLLVVSQYLSCLRAAAEVRAAQSRVQLAQALYEQASDLQKHGVGTGLDTLRANVQLQNETQRETVAETGRKTAIYGLARLLNLDPQAEIEFGDELSFYEIPEFGASQSIERALSNRPEMKALAAREKQIQSEERAVSESRLPAIRFDGNWYEQGVSASTVIPTYVYQVRVDMPVFTGGRIHAEIAKQKLELKKIAQEKQDLRNQIALEVKTAIAQLEAARHEVEVANLGVQLARTEVDQARDRFQAGVANNIEVITAQDELARAYDNQIGALYRYNQARADLSRATGQMESLYAK